MKLSLKDSADKSADWAAVQAEVVIAAEARQLSDAILERQKETLKRLFGAQG